MGKLFRNAPPCTAIKNTHSKYIHIYIQIHAYKHFVDKTEKTENLGYNVAPTDTNCFFAARTSPVQMMKNMLLSYVRTRRRLFFRCAFNSLLQNEPVDEFMVILDLYAVLFPFSRLLHPFLFSPFPSFVLSCK